MSDNLTIPQSNTILNNLVIFIHFVLYLLVVFSPFYISCKLKENYQNYISAFMITVIITWSIFGKCIVSIFEGSSRNGVINSFFNNLLGVPITPHYEKIIDLFGGFIFVIVALYYSSRGRKFIIALFYAFFLITSLKFHNRNTY